MQKSSVNMGRRIEVLSTAQLHGIEETRVCLMPDEDGQVPFVDFDRRNQHELPCNRVIPELGTTRLDFPATRVLVGGCRAQRLAGLCPRELGLTPEEI